MKTMRERERERERELPSRDRTQDFYLGGLDIVLK
jgi:hypothetical protein